MSDDHSIDFLKKEYRIPEEREVRTTLAKRSRFFALGTVVVVVVTLFFSYKLAQVTHGDQGDIGNVSLFSTLTTSFARLVGSEDKTLTGETDDRVNVLLLGVGGAGHDGPQLSDTIIFGSFKPSTSELGLLSIPRDLTVDIPGYGYRKINAANAYGEQQGKGQGLTLASEVVSNVVGEPIHYTVRVDFSGFEKFIDQLGGVDVYVERSFTDTTFPVDDGLGNVTTVSFTQGWAHMDGKTALTYARSRHGDNGEGTDFARAARQQKILLAVKDKSLSLGVLLNPAKVSRMLSTLNTHIDTNLSLWEIMKLAGYVPQIDSRNIAMKVLDTSPGSPLYATTMNGAYVILPREDDWSEVHAIADNLFAEATGSATATEAVLATPPASATLEIQNGTSIAGLAAITAQRFEGSTFEVVTISNATAKDVERTIIYDFTNGEKAVELATLRDFLDADVAMTTAGWLYAPTQDAAVADSAVSPTSSGIDFLIIVGQDAASLALR